MVDAAIDDSDDFGLPTDSPSCKRFAGIRTGTLGVSLFVTALCIAAEAALLHGVRNGRLFVFGNVAIPGHEYIMRALALAAISQVSCLVSGLMTLIAVNKWAYPRFLPGTRSRLIYTALKWSTTTLLIAANAYFLEYLFEYVFIIQGGADFLSVHSHHAHFSHM